MNRKALEIGKQIGEWLWHKYGTYSCVLVYRDVRSGLHTARRFGRCNRIPKRPPSRCPRPRRNRNQRKSGPAPCTLRSASPNRASARSAA